MQKIARLSAARERSALEVGARLQSAGFDPTEIQAGIDRAKACGIIDDGRFAEALIRGRVSAGKGRQGIELELDGHSIDPESVPGWPGAFGLGDEESEVARATRLLQAKPPTSANFREAAYRKLIRKGFSSSVAATASRVWSEGLGRIEPV
ncbi:MAG: RecX family transcriptional regulator [Eggerthellaceae bacterium]|nr:RecX family transcriptional regulator [Eggerthellaceae bacterium]